MASTKRRSFGQIKQMRSGRFQASYVVDEIRFYGPTTYDTRTDASEFLAGVQTDIGRGLWKPPAPATSTPTTSTPTLSFGTYATSWMGSRRLAKRTRAGYRDLLDDHILPVFGPTALTDITNTMVREWYGTLAKGRPTTRTRAYGLLRTILGTALEDEYIEHNPCRIRGAGTNKRASVTVPASLDELNTLVIALPPRYRLMALLAAWCAMRFGELTELRRKDINLKHGIIRIMRGVTHPTDDNGHQECVIEYPKAESIRNVTLPPHLNEFVEIHLDEHCRSGLNGLLFPPAAGDGCHMKPSTLYRVYYPARKHAGREDLRFHDLRHTGAVFAAEAGATLAELMERLGHRTPSAAMRYQHVARGRAKIIADALSEKAKAHGPNVIDLTTRFRKPA